MMAGTGGGWGILLQENVEAVQEVMQGSAHYAENVTVFFIAVTENLSTQSKLQRVQGNS